MACSPQSKIAPKYLFPSHSDKYPGFVAGQYLEYMTETFTPTINIAKITEVKEHILLLEVGPTLFIFFVYFNDLKKFECELNGRFYNS